MAAGWFDILRRALGWHSAAPPDLATVSERFSLQGTSEARLSIVGTSNQRLLLQGTTDSRITLVGT